MALSFTKVLIGRRISLDFFISRTSFNCINLMQTVFQFQLRVLVYSLGFCICTCTRYHPLSVCYTASPFDSLLGPLLPEHLDVRNIPGSKGREITINLCGKCYFFVYKWRLIITDPKLKADNAQTKIFMAGLDKLSR